MSRHSEESNIPRRTFFNRLLLTSAGIARAVNFGPWAGGREAILTLSSPATYVATDNCHRERQEQFSV